MVAAADDIGLAVANACTVLASGTGEGRVFSDRQYEWIAS
jgi:hypothetical protein